MNSKMLNLYASAVFLLIFTGTMLVWALPILISAASTFAVLFGIVLAAISIPIAFIWGRSIVKGVMDLNNNPNGGTNEDA